VPPDPGRCAKYTGTALRVVATSGVPLEDTAGGWQEQVTSDPGGPRRFADVHWFAELDSTNTWLLDRAGAGAPEGTVAVADRQLAGRGRLGRRWESPPGSGLLTSILFRPPMAAEELFAVPALVALAARRAIGETAEVSVRAKWPNDLVLDDLKLAGVLTETRATGAGGLAVVVGIGINVSWPMPGPAATELRATCLEAAAGRPVDRRALLDAMLFSIEERRGMLEDAAGRASIIRELESVTATIGRVVRVELADEEVVGTAVGLDHHGRIVLETDGEQRVVAAGDVVHLR
jgi:BirA family biotin operon repressor/biotin-[acetyl-CoA-carboxylase] ligase